MDTSLITILAIIVSSIVAFFAFKFSKPSNKNSKLSYNDKVYLHANLELELNKNDISNRYVRAEERVKKKDFKGAIEDIDMILQHDKKNIVLVF
jgi:hypothetical protein